MALDKTIKLRLPGEELDAWKHCAEAVSMSLSAWVRERCNGNAQALLPPGAIVDTNNPQNPSQGDFEAAVTEQVQKAKKTCPHGTAKGYRCWVCGGLAKIGE